MRSSIKMAKTDGSHLDGPGGDIANFNPQVEESSEPGRLDGNNVNMDKTVAAIQENSLMYQTLINARNRRSQIISETLDLAGR